MIDTDKYERMLKDETYRLDKRNNMMALKLLAEVKRLREQVECSKGEHEWELDDYLDGDPNEPVRIVGTCVACGLVRERIE